MPSETPLLVAAIHLLHVISSFGEEDVDSVLSDDDKHP